MRAQQEHIRFGGRRVVRWLVLTGFALSPLAWTGCAGTWDTITSRWFREQPVTTLQRLIVPEDPLVVLTAQPPREGDERAMALRRLKEPIKNNGSQAEQDAVMELLAKAATADPSPVIRMEAIGALGRFEDPRAAGILMTAYQTAHGRKENEPAPKKPADPGVVPAAGLSAGRSPTKNLGTERFPITGPTGYPPEWVTAIRCRAAEALGRTNQPEAVRFLAAIAGAAERDIVLEGSEERDIRLAAVRGLGHCRQPDAVVALAQVLASEADKNDTALIGRTHEGLVRLTGKRLPPDPQRWEEVVQAGVQLAPPPGLLETVIEQAMLWTK